MTQLPIIIRRRRYERPLPRSPPTRHHQPSRHLLSLIVALFSPCLSRYIVDPCRELGFTPHVAARKYSRIDARTTRHAGYEISQRKRKRVEEPFGWMKTYGLLGKLRHCGRDNVDWLFRLTATAYNVTAEAQRLAAEAFEHTGEKVRRFTDIHYGARTWDRPRRVKFLLASTCPYQSLYFLVARRLASG